MRRRLIRLIGIMVVLPVAARAAEHVADRLEDRDGPTVPSRLFRQASVLADRRSLSGRGRFGSRRDRIRSAGRRVSRPRPRGR